MLEAVCLTCRTVAGEARLRILHVLTAQDELPGKDIARRAGLTPPGASKHMARLVGARLASARRSSAYVYYRLATEGGNGFGHVVAQLIARACRDPRWATAQWLERRVLHLSNETVSRVGPRAARVLDIIFDAATAFANVRRLQILRLLSRRSPCELSRIRQELRMSLWACERHVDKLARRGYVRRIAPGHWALTSPCRTPVHEALLAAVVDVLP